MTHPREVALTILAVCFGHGHVGHPELEPFQADALLQLRSILHRHGGAILADSVGLGKTHVAVALIRETIAAGNSVMVTAPAQLRTHWTRHLRGVPRWRWMSHTTLSRAAPARRSPATLVVVDEAHAFRNPATRRYAALAGLCEHGRVLLLTATPVNNSLRDFQHLVRLFATRSQFIDIGVPDLDNAVESAIRGGSTLEIRRIADAVMVRRTRAAITATASSRLRFPACGPVETVRCDSAPASLLQHVLHIVPALRFTAHGNDDRAARELMRIGLLKRLESSPAALRASVRRHVRLLEHFIDAAHAGLLFHPRTDITPAVEVDAAAQLAFDPLTLPPWPAARDRTAAISEAERDLHAFRHLLRLIPPEPRTHSLQDAAGNGAPSDRPAVCADPKLARLRALLDDELAHETVLLFTEYQETARALWRSLSTRPGIAMVHGGDARLGRGRSTRRAVIERFAPIANRARTPRPAERVRLLIATDVLAEGLNLQDARVVISYDMPWNPVRLAQRIGRIDRLGSPHEHIRALAFVPDRGLDQLLGLMRRIRRKLRHIRVIGGDAPWSLGCAPERSLIAGIDAAAEARAAAHRRYTEIAHPPAAPARTATPARSGAPANAATPLSTYSAGQPPAAAARWRLDYDAALCCFRTGADITLVLTAAGRPPESASAACWTALLDALDSSHAAPTPDPASINRHVAAALAFLRRDPAPGPLPPSTPPRAAALAGAVVLRWLAARPGGPSADETRTADHLLQQLRRGSRAGTDPRIEHLIRSARSDDHAVRSLARLLVDATHAAHPGAPPSPELVGVLLLSAHPARSPSHTTRTDALTG